MRRRRCFHGINAMIISDVTANENARNKRNELEFCLLIITFNDAKYKQTLKIELKCVRRVSNLEHKCMNYGSWTIKQ